MTDEPVTQQSTSTDILKKSVIDYVFQRATEATRREEAISDLTHETGFVRGVRLAKSMLWKYTPEEIRKMITDLYQAYEDKKADIDKGSMTEQNKTVNKQMVADDVSMQVMELLLVVLQYSPISTDFKTMEVYGDTETLIKAIRTDKHVKLFSSGESDAL